MPTLTLGTPGILQAVLGSTPITTSPFPAARYDPHFAPSPALQAALARLGNRFNQLHIALVDLTGAPSNPPYAGLRDRATISAASMVKIAAMYAAFELRAAVSRALSAMPASTTAADAFQQLEVAWKPIIDSKFPRRPKGFPALKRIFDLTSSGTHLVASFTDKGKSQTQLAARHDKGPYDDLGFLDLMKLMIGWSDNAAAGKCILALGFPYINGALADAGLYDASGDGGLWLSGSYSGTTWGPDPGSLAPVGRVHQAASARATASMLTLLASGTLVDAASTTEMLALMDKNGNGSATRSFLLEGLDGATPPRTASAAFSKLGIFTELHDCLFVERIITAADGGSVNLRYVAVGLGAPDSADGLKLLHDLALKLDDAILAAQVGSGAAAP